MAPLTRERPGAALLRPGFHLEPGMRVGLFGGSFNPAHEGHAHVAETARRRLRLHKVIWLVSPQNPLKSSRHTAPLARRLDSAGRQARGPGMLVSDIEARLGVRYSLDTILKLKARFPGVRFVWIIGSDNLATFHRWRGWRRISCELPIAVIARPGSTVRSRFAPAAQTFAVHRLPSSRALRLAGTPPPAWAFLNARLHPASSTALRAASAS